jgi:hypothetical protein
MGNEISLLRIGMETYETIICLKCSNEFMKDSFNKPICPPCRQRLSAKEMSTQVEKGSGPQVSPQEEL